MRPDGPWMPAEAWQYNSAIEPARIFVMRLRIGRLVPMVGVDTYRRGRAHMVGSLFGRRVADGSGDEFDHSELVIYLNDAILLAPVDFVADRYATLPAGLVLTPWRTPIHEWSVANARSVPARASVQYDLPAGPFVYAEGGFMPDSVAYNLAPMNL